MIGAIIWKQLWNGCNNLCLTHHLITPREARAAHWWEHSPPTIMAWVEILASTPLCGLSLLLVLSFAPRGFSLGTSVFPSPQKLTFPNSNSTRNQVNEGQICGCATSKSLFIYHRFRWYATFENKTPTETFPKFPSIMHVIDRSDRNPPITTTSVTFWPSLRHASGLQLVDFDPICR